MDQSSRLKRRDVLRIMAGASGMALLAACGASTGGSGGGSEAVELTYMSPDRELGQQYDKIIIDSFNERMKKEGKPWSVKAVPGPATDNDYNTKVNVDAAAGTMADIVGLNSSVVADLAASGRGERRKTLREA